MKQLFDKISDDSATLITKNYSTSFSVAVKLLAPSIRQAIYNIYGFVRVADEIVDSFEGYPKEQLLSSFEKEYESAMINGISTNPVINAFQRTVKEYKIEEEMVQAFLRSMRADLTKQVYRNQAEIDEYIYGSADVVGLMCLKVFVNGDKELYEKLKIPAMKLGTAFQKVNFLRDIKDDMESLNRFYFPNIDFNNFNQETMKSIVMEIESDFEYAFKNGILKLPLEAKFGVYIAYVYYKRLLKKLKSALSDRILEERIRISNFNKVSLLAQGYIRYKMNWL